MANFHTHLTVATSASVIAGGLVAACGLLSPIETVIAIGIGIIGGFLPDVDSDHSTSIKIVFDILAAILGFCGIFILMPYLGILIGISSWFVIFLLVRFGIIHLFRKLTVHRGIFHSIPMGIFLSLLLGICIYKLTSLSLTSWFFSLFLFYGFCVHLLLDEIYSVNLSGVTLKKSFGTAFKLISFKEIIRYLILYTLIGFIFFFMPNYQIVQTELNKANVISHIQHNLYPPFLNKSSENIS